MKKSELKKYFEKPEAELAKFVEDQREILLKLSLDLAQGKVKNIRTMRDTRKTIARALTELTKRNKKI
mgnify:CR=1 FL=1